MCGGISHTQHVDFLFSKYVTWPQNVSHRSRQRAETDGEITFSLSSIAQLTIFDSSDGTLWKNVAEGRWKVKEGTTVSRSVSPDVVIHRWTSRSYGCFYLVMQVLKVIIIIIIIIVIISTIMMTIMTI